MMRQTVMDAARLDGRWDTTFDRPELRRQWERLLHRAGFLDPQDRTLLELAAERRGRISLLSPLLRQNPAAIRRRIREITRRLTGCELEAVLTYPEAFTRLEKICLCEHLVRRRPLVRIARDYNVSVYALRKSLTLARNKVHKLWKHRSP